MNAPHTTAKRKFSPETKVPAYESHPEGVARRRDVARKLCQSFLTQLVEFSGWIRSFLLEHPHHTDLLMQAGVLYDESYLELECTFSSELRLQLGLYRIIVPTVYRSNYLTALKAMSQSSHLRRSSERSTLRANGSRRCPGPIWNPRAGCWKVAKHLPIRPKSSIAVSGCDCRHLVEQKPNGRFAAYLRRWPHPGRGCQWPA